MTDHVCSLITSAGSSQPVPVGTNYTLIRFPYGGESFDGDGMHAPLQPDGITSTYPDPRSGLIWPAHDAWADLHALLFWEPGDYSEIRDRFVRDPLGLFEPPNSTCTEDHPPTPGGQFIAKSWAIFVHPDTPIGLMVRHNAPVAVDVTFAEFKLSYHL